MAYRNGMREASSRTWLAQFWSRRGSRPVGGTDLARDQAGSAAVAAGVLEGDGFESGGEAEK